MKQTQMQLYFEGAAGNVTGSCSRLSYTCGDEKYQILVDCGLMQEAEEGEISVPKWSFEPAEISVVLLTHAHIDHCGALPLLYNNGYAGKVFATDATIELAQIMLADIARTTKLFEKDEIDKIRWQSVDSIEAGREQAKYFPILPFIRANFIRSSHILGACGVYVQWFKSICEEGETIEKGANAYENYQTIFFSGDVGRSFDGINEESTFLKPNFYPFTSDKQREFFVLESTYGNRVHGENTDYKSKLAFLEKTLKTALSGNGYAVIPAFALDRTQTILGDLFDVLKTKAILEKNNIDDEAIKAEIKKIESESASDKKAKKEKKAKIAELQKKLKERKIICVHSLSPLGNQINRVYAKNLGVESKTMDKNGKIRFRYLNRNPEIPDEYKNEENTSSDFESDDNVKQRTSCLLEGKFSGEDFANDFVFTNEIMFEQKKVGSLLKSLPKNASVFCRPQSVVVGASGMCDRGFILGAIEKALKDENATIILTGYTPKGSAGEIIKRFSNGIENAGFSKQELFNKTIPSTKVRLFEVKAKVVDMSEFYSAHADQKELLTYVFDNPAKPRTKPVQVFLNHGSIAGGLTLADKIDAFNSRIANGAVVPRTLVTSSAFRAFDISGDEVISLSTDEEKSAHEKLIDEAVKLLAEEGESESAEKTEQSSENAIEGEKAKKEEDESDDDEIDVFIKNEIVKKMPFLILDVDIKEAVTSVIKPMLTKEKLNVESAKEARNALLAWRKETEKNAHFPELDFLKEKIESDEIFTSDTLQGVLSDYEKRFSEMILDGFSETKREIDTLQALFDERSKDSLLCDMPYTLSLPRQIDKMSKSFLRTIFDALKKEKVRAFAKEKLKEWEIFPKPLGEDEKITENMLFSDEVLD